MHNHFRQRFLRLAQNAVGASADLAPLDHQGLKGTLREIVIGSLFNPILPTGVEIATGKVVAHDGQVSAQIDLILHSQTILPPALYDEKNGFVPVESALYTVEVKSRLTAEGLDEAISNARSVRSLPILQTEHWLPTLVQNNPIQRISTTTPYPVNALFAFGSDLTGGKKSELDRYREKDFNADTAPAVQAICVVGKGYWYSKKDGGWKYLPASPDLDELMSFLGGLTNTLPQLIAWKGRPRLGNYLDPSGLHIDV